MGAGWAHIVDRYVALILLFVREAKRRMPTIAEHVDIHASPERVWDMLAALRYLHLWLADVAGMQAINTAPVGNGTTFELMRGGTRAAWTVSMWQPPHLLRFSTVNNDAHYEWTLEPTQTGTQLTMRYERTARSFSRLLPGGSQRRAVHTSLARLNELITFNRDIALIHGVGDE